jgi:dTDP-4-dehydrorhamnose 3,5-epimerase
MGDQAESGARPPVEIDAELRPARDEQLVTREGEQVGTSIDGVRVRPAVTHSDERGSLTEVYNPAWGFTDEPLVYLYHATIHPGQKKGWVVHLEQDDRLYFTSGVAKVALYDARPSSPTHRTVQELFFDDAGRGLLRIPAGVFHLVVNVGATDIVAFINMPTRAYRHENPDKYRLPADGSAIPYTS